MITIRKATAEDIDVIAILMHDLSYPATSDEVRVRFESISRHDDYKTLLAVAEDGQVAGMIGMSKNYFYEHNGTYIRVLVLVVSKDHRNEGVGKRLMVEADNWAAETGANTIVINSGNREDRKNAHVFYKGLGYEIKSSGFVKKLRHG
jgi:GNAT superfamily N-acetyltransferase